MPQQGTYPLGTRTITLTDSLTGVVTSATADVTMSSLIAFLKTQNGVGGATGGGTDKVFVETNQTVTASYTLSSGFNAVSAGPVTINDGVAITVPTGATWTIV